MRRIVHGSRPRVVLLRQCKIILHLVDIGKLSKLLIQRRILLLQHLIAQISVGSQNRRADQAQAEDQDRACPGAGIRLLFRIRQLLLTADIHRKREFLRAADRQIQHRLRCTDAKEIRSGLLGIFPAVLCDRDAVVFDNRADPAV